MTDHTRSPLTEPEQRVSSYEEFTSQVADGYGMSMYEYTNDLACRRLIEEHKGSPELAKLWPRVEAADQKLKHILLPTKSCIYGNYPKSWFWYWGYPPNSPEIESDLRAVGAI